MIRVRRDILLSSLVLAAGLAPLAWFFLASPGFADTEGLHMLALMLGGFVALCGALALANFLWALRMLRRQQAGHGVIGRWHIDAATLGAFEAAEAMHPGPGPWRIAWRPSPAERRDGLEVRFAPELVTIGDRLLAIPTAGVQSIRSVAIEQGHPPVMALLVRSPAPAGSGTITHVDEMLRLPVTDMAAGQAVLRHCRSALAGHTVVAPMRRVWRMRIGVVLLVVLPACVPIGWHLAQQPWRRSEAEMILPFVLMLGGIIGTIGAAVMVLLAWRFHRRQHGKG